LLRQRVEALGVPVQFARHWAEGGAGAVDLAHAVLRACDQPGRMRFVYDQADPLWLKLQKVATTVYRAAAVSAPPEVHARIRRWQEAGLGELPICVAKTPYSFSADPAQRGAAEGHVLHVREVRLAAGAGFVVMICGDIMTMPGLPKVPAAEKIDLTADGKVVGLF
jgi:formate--tetrahydrofolate ligase